jgi:hypothetical protein
MKILKGHTTPCLRGKLQSFTSGQVNCGIVDVWWDNHVLIFYPIIYYRYAEYTDELQLDDLPVAG